MFALAAAGTECSKNETAISNETYGIVLNSYSALRIDPFVFAGTITYLNKGDIVEILQRSKEKTWVGKEYDFWYRVKTKDGTAGWVFGRTIGIQASKDKAVMDKIVSDFMEIEAAQIKKDLAGKWWSINEFGDFTDHCLEIYESNKYRSYVKEQETRAIAGTYKFDFNKNEIIFSGGTSFKGNLDLVKRGNVYVIKGKINDRELRFSRISLELPPEPEIKDTNPKNPPASNNGN
jgi:hypothetical protein